MGEFVWWIHQGECVCVSLCGGYIRVSVCGGYIRVRVCVDGYIKVVLIDNQGESIFGAYIYVAKSCAVAIPMNVA